MNIMSKITLEERIEISLRRSIDKVFLRKEFDKFVKETHKITGDILITSPNDFNGLNEYLQNYS